MESKVTHETTSNNNKIYYPKHYLLVIVLTFSLIMVLLDFVLYQAFINNQKIMIGKNLDAVVNEFNLNLIQIENNLLNFSKTTNYSKVKDLSKKDIIDLIVPVAWSSFNYDYFIDEIKFTDSEQDSNKQLFFINNHLYLLIETEILSTSNELSTYKMQLLINIAKLTNYYFKQDNPVGLLQFNFRYKNQNNEDYEYIFLPSNHIVRKLGSSENNKTYYNSREEFKLVNTKNILDKDDWQIEAYLKISIIQEFLRTLLMLSFVIVFVLLFICNLLYRKLYSLEWQRLTIIKDKKHFQQRAEITLESINNGVIITNSTKQIVYINHVVENYLAVKFADVYFKCIDELIPELVSISESQEDKVKLNDLNIMMNNKDYYFDVQSTKLFDDTGLYIGTAVFMHDLTMRKQAQEHINYLAFHDDITGLPNKVALLDYYDKVIVEENKFVQEDVRLFSIVVNTPSLRRINDTIGYENGDKCLKSMLSVIDGFLLKSEVHNGLYRINVDTVAIVVVYDRVQHGKSAILFITNFINNLLFELLKPVHVNEQDIFLQYYIGAAIYPDNFKIERELGTISPAMLLRFAEIAMSAARKKGLNKFVFYSDELNASFQEMFDLENKLRSAINHNKLELLFHPQLDLATNKLRGFESLVRWQRDDGNIVLPGTFIPLLEKSGLIVTVGDWVLKEACKSGVMLLTKGIEFDSLAVNISGLQLQTENFVSRVENIVKKSGFPIEKLELEITESILLENPEKIIDVLARLRRIGVKIALDDFGTGFSSLSYLKQLPLDYLKIDRTFVNEINSGDTRLLKAIIAMAKSLNLRTIAEGVESLEHVSFLRKNLCDIIQGYYISRPLSLDAVLKSYG